MKVALAQINPIIGDLEYNVEKIVSYISEARARGAELVVFPELAITGYPPEDLLLLPSFIDAATLAVEKVVDAAQGISVVLGCVRRNPHAGEKNLFNSAALIEDGVLIGYQDKLLLPTYDVFSERRYFEPGSSTRVWNLSGERVGVTICEDIWHHAGAVEYANYPRDPIEELKREKPAFLVNLSASPYYFLRQQTRLTVCQKAAITLDCPVLICNQIGGNDSLIFDGYSLAVDGKGALFQYAQGFQEELLLVDLDKKREPVDLPFDAIADLFQALVLGLKDYFNKLGWNKACLGLSGGIDSAVVAAIAREALGRENVVTFGLPSFYSSEHSLSDAKQVADNLGISFQVISIEKPFEAFLDTLKPVFGEKVRGLTEENLQPRIRGTLLMALSNQYGYLLLSTGNKSEMGMGYMTLYGDMCGGLAVIGDVTKEQVYALAHYINREGEVIPKAILEKPPSAELKPGQKDTDSLPPYPIVDRVLEDYVENHLSPEQISERHGFPLSMVKELVCKIHGTEYKRRQAPPPLRVTKKAFTVGRRFPIVQHWNMQR